VHVRRAAHRGRAAISLEDYVRLPHVLTSLRPGERGVVDDALAKLGLRRDVVLTTPRFLTVPFLTARAPVVVTMHARLARFFAAELGLSLSPPPVDLPEVSISLLWHASYDHDPGHRWLRGRSPAWRKDRTRGGRRRRRRRPAAGRPGGLHPSALDEAGRLPIRIPLYWFRRGSSFGST
jgi:DNA-binding transcriptional LysR family regulator